MCGTPPRRIVDDVASSTRSQKGGIVMAIAAVWDFPGRTPDQYEEVFRLGGAAIHAQPNRLSHVCYRTETGIRVVDVWQDEASFAAFGAVLGPAVAAAGLDAPPEIYPVQGYMAVDGVRNP
jgi:hypothetical protein